MHHQRPETVQWHLHCLDFCLDVCVAHAENNFILQLLPEQFAHPLVRRLDVVKSGTLSESGE